MQVNAARLRGQRTIVGYRAQQKAQQFLSRVLTDDRGIAVLYGPSASGKSVVANQFVRQVQAKIAVAVVDGARLKTDELLSRILEQFGYNVVLDSIDEMLNMLTVIVVQQTRTHEPPLLIIENINDMFPSTLGALCKLASLSINGRNALRMVLVSNRDIERVIRSPSMKSIADRIIGSFEVGPMTSREASRYLYEKLRAAGIDRPDDVFSIEVCEKLHALSRGWPGELDEMALSIIRQAEQYPIRLDDIVEPDTPVRSETPKLILTCNGQAPLEILLSEKRALIGRSDLSDIVVEDQFVSNQHALLIRNENAIVVVDLKSRNGTFVNSRRVQSKVLLHDDIISIGDHRMKMVYADGHASNEIDGPDLADTAKMKNIADARRAREQNIPTLVVVAKDDSALIS